VTLDFAATGPLAKARETVRTFARGRPSLRDLLASRTGSFDRAHAVLPSDAVVGESVDLTVQVWDEYERLHGDFSGTFRLGSTDPDATLPDRVRFAPGDDAPVVRQRGIDFATPGVQYLTLTHEATGERFVSNPVRVHAEEPEVRTFWGDIHLHSTLSDGTGGVERGLRYGREVMDLDVVAYTDHDTMGFFIPPSWQRRRMHRRYFERTLDAVEAANDPGEYVTLPGYEWTKQPNVGGHLNVYFDTAEHAALFDSHDPATDTYEKLWARLHEYNDSDAHDGRALSVPHHPAESMYPFDFSAVDYDDEMAPLVEVYSQWGSSERPERDGNRFPLRMGQGEAGEDGHYTQDAHDMGYRVGLTASSDYHGPHPGHSLIHAKPHLPSLADWRDGGLGWSNIWRAWNEGSYPGGLQAIRVPELTREAVFDAMGNRRVYATSQPHRILLEFSVGGVAVGDAEGTVTVDDAEAEREVRASVAGTAPLESVTVVKNGEAWRTLDRAERDDIDAYTAEATWHDDTPVTGPTWDGDGDADGGEADYYYLRVHQHDDGMAWAGPVWVASA
jgi:hypothetical protein